MPRLIDVMHQGLDRVIGAWEVDELIVDPGPEPCMVALLEALGGVAPRALLLTHIHLDHAGASGALVRRFPGLRVYVHERGAPHLADPARLLASAKRLYGDDMQRLWGDVVPVPEANIVALSGGETVEGMRVAYTPGHASHHVAYLDESRGDAYVGDLAGVRVPPSDLVLAPTPPPDIDLDAWRHSLDVVRGWRPAALRLTHFGGIDEVEAHIDAVEASLEWLRGRAASAGRDDFVASLRDRVAEASDAETVGRFELAVPAEHVWLGMERFLARPQS